MLIPLVLLSIVILLLLIYIRINKKYDYWRLRNVPYEEPSFILGNYGNYILQKEFNGYLNKRQCKKFENEPFYGTYFGTEPALVVKDLDLIKTVMTKDFANFNSRDVMDYAKKEIIGRSVIFSNGDYWKLARSTLTPMFSSAKMKSMFPLIEKCAKNFEEILDNLKEYKGTKTSKNNIEEYEMRDLTSEFTMDSITSCAFGVELHKMPYDNGFRRIGNMFFNVNVVSFSFYIMRVMWPGIFYAFNLSAFPRSIYSFFMKMLQEVFVLRGYKPSSRHDFIDLLLTAQETNKAVTDDFMAAQAAAMFLAGYETSANTMAFTLHELAIHPELQQRAAEEVDEYLAKRGNKLDYDCTSELPFLDACMHEALRRYPVLPIITREVSKEYTMPSGLVLERGLRVHIPAYYLHHHEDYFPDPDQFKPERFLPENRDNVKPYSYLPFGEGPRVCVGSRFAKMQVMAGLITVLKKYTVKPGPKTERELRLAPRSLSTLTVGGLWLTLEPRQGWEGRKFAKNIE